MESIQSLKHIADGRTAEIFAWEDGKVLKLFRSGFDDADYESQMARAVIEGGVNAPKIYETVEIEGRRGIIYERVDGDTLLAVFQQKPLLIMRLARQFADIQATMHAKTAPNLPTLKEKLRYKIQHAEHLTDAVKSDVLTYLDKLPDGDSVCHGDFHPENILVTDEEARIIDWVDASQGDALADVARTYLLLTVGKIQGNLRTRLMLGTARSAFARLYLRHYFGLRGGSFDEVKAWIVPVAAGRLSEGIENPESLVDIVIQGLKHETG
ncbi:MAG: aminoglycoside phosphotransferase family protein [Aggregatilineales bacterium]